MKIGDIFGAGDVANLANNIIDKVLPDKEKADEAKFKVQELLQNGELAKMTNETQMFQAEVDDRKSARTIHTSFVDYLAVIALLVSVGILCGILFKGLAPGISDMTAGMIIGMFVGVVPQILNYYFGSSSSSKVKTESMADALTKK